MSQKTKSSDKSADRDGNRDKPVPRRAEFTSQTPVLEWIFATFGFMLVVAMLSFIAMNAVETDRSPPKVTVKAEKISPNGKGYLVEIRADNAGGSTAAGLTVEGVLKDGETSVATSYMSFDYLPPHSYRTGGLFFDKNPEALTFELRPLGFQTP